MFETIVNKVYHRPTVVSERCFETTVLGCSKDDALTGECNQWGGVPSTS
jgi:hypothetical protein